MAIIDDSSIYLADFGKPVVLNGVTGTGILDMPSEEIINGVIVSTDYSLTAAASFIGEIAYGATLLVDGYTYEVKNNLLQQDGLFRVLTLDRVSEIGLIYAGTVIQASTLIKALP